uniref:Uncharacterized protein n=1 Tax=Stomoxys calcitrans TaxID=35570 RepID=A0A1I8P270_STOCA
IPIRLGAPAHLVNGDHISQKFFAAVENGERHKAILQSTLQNFVENLQRNLSTSNIRNTAANEIEEDSEKIKVRRLYDLADYFEYSSEMANSFAMAAENFFEVTKKESIALLQKLRQIPSAQRYLPTDVKMHLTDYFAEMEYFHVMFSEIVDESLEYFGNTLRSIQSVFIHFADIQRDLLREWNLRLEGWCFSAYVDFLQLWSTEIFKCASTKELNIAYDVYATTETTAKHIMRQLEFRIQRLYNCFIFGGYQIKCKFLRDPDVDFEPLFAKLDELQQYLDIKIKMGRISLYRSHRNADELVSTKVQEQCIPLDFPQKHMMESLNQCYVPN